MPDLIYNVKFNIDDNLQEGVAGAQRYEQQIEELQAEVAQLTSSLERATKQQNRFNKGAKGAGATLGRTNKQVAIGNQLFFSLSDGIQDSAQFSQGFSTGMRAIGNNIGFTAELMAVYIAQTAAMNAGTASFSTVMRGLGKQMMGVGGIILALNIAITALTVFGRKSKEAEKEVKSLGDTFVQASNEISSSVFGEASYLLTEGVIADLGREFSVLSKNIEESTGFFKNISNTLINDFNIASQETIENSRLFGEAQQENAKTNKDSTKALKNLINTTADKVGVDKEEAAAILDVLSKETEEIRNKERMRKAIIALIPEAKDYYNIQEQTSKALDEFNIGIDGSAEALELQKTAVANLITQYKSLYEAGEEELRPFLVHLNEVYDNLVSTLEKASETEEDYASIKTQLRALQLEDISIIELTSSTRQDMIDEINREIVAVGNSNLELDDRIERLEILYDLLQDFNELRPLSDIIKEEAMTMGFEAADEEAKSFAKQYEEYEKQATRSRLRALKDRQQKEKEIEQERLEVAKDIQKAYIDLETQTQNTRINIVATASQAMSALSMGFAKENKAASLVFLAIEQGLRIAQVSMSTNQTIAQLQQSASEAYAKAAAAYSGAGFLASAFAGGMAAKPILAQIPLAKASGAAAIAAIAATTIGRGAKILGGGGGNSSSGGAAGASEPAFGFEMNQIEGEQRFRSPMFSPTSGQGKMQPKVEVQVLADRKKLYYMVKQGEEEYRSIKA